MRQVSIRLLTFVLFTMCQTISANQVRDFSLEDKSRLSDFVFVGTVFSLHEGQVGDDNEAGYAEIEVTQKMKGNSNGIIIKFLFDGPIVELNPDCCVLNEEYLFFATTTDNKLYRSVNGRFGVYRIQEGVVLGLKDGETEHQNSLSRIAGEIEKAINN